MHFLCPRCCAVTPGCWTVYSSCYCIPFLVVPPDGSWQLFSCLFVACAPPPASSPPKDVNRVPSTPLSSSRFFYFLPTLFSLSQRQVLDLYFPFFPLSLGRTSPPGMPRYTCQQIFRDVFRFRLHHVFFFFSWYGQDQCRNEGPFPPPVRLFL